MTIIRVRRWKNEKNLCNWPLLVIHRTVILIINNYAYADWCSPTSVDKIKNTVLGDKVRTLSI